MTKEKLIELSKQYFNGNPKLNEIIACSDGNFFYTESDASYHFAKNKIDKYVIKRSDLNPTVIKEPIKEVEPIKVVKKVNKNDK